MSKKTLSLPKEPSVSPEPERPEVVETFTRAQLMEMLSRLPGANQDPTLDLPTGEIPRELIADKSSLPPDGERSSAPVQPPARLWGVHLTPSPIQAQVERKGVVDPRTGNAFNQVMKPANGGSISPPPTKHFR